MKNVPLYLAGEFVDSQTSEWIDVTNPATNEVIAKAPCTTDAEMRKAIESASGAADPCRSEARGYLRRIRPW